ncbi:MAG TPA: DEAD/DEAH box helicase [Acidimicrobiales bacterium]|nr:DEAD/DEAH box helicase [Acidimicrobiales bacterium]
MTTTPRPSTEGPGATTAADLRTRAPATRHPPPAADDVPTPPLMYHGGAVPPPGRRRSALVVGAGWCLRGAVPWRRTSLGREKSETELNHINFETLVSAEAGGYASAEELAALEAAPDRWATCLWRLLRETDEALLVAAGRITGEERDQVLNDITSERQSLASAIRRLTGQDVEAPPAFAGGTKNGQGGNGNHAGNANANTRARNHNNEDDDNEDDGATGRHRTASSRYRSVDDSPVDDGPAAAPALQASWANGRVVVWAGNRAVPPAADEELAALLDAAGAAAIDWTTHHDVKLPSGDEAPALAAPISGALGWLVGVGAGQVGHDAGPSVRWLGDVAVWATELVAQGRMVPTLARVDPGSGGGADAQGPNGPSADANGANGRAGAGTAQFSVRWAPAVIDGPRLRSTALRMPGAVAALDHTPAPERVCRTLLAAAVDAVCRVGAARLVAAATVSVARSRGDVCEAVLAGLAGTPFHANARHAADLADDLRRWATPVTADRAVGLTVRLDAPEKDGGWLLTVEATGVERQPLPVERALATAGRARAQEVETQLRRLERLLPALRRPSSRRGQVVMGTDEAWELLTGTGNALVAAGFDVQVPAISTRRASPQLKLWAGDMGGPSKVGAQQLSHVRWSVLFGDAELDAAGIAKLAAEARPLVKVRGRWVELERADLDAAARALAEQSSTTELSGAAIIRMAVGLEGTALGGTVAVDGGGWAVDLVRGATDNPPQPIGAPDGFNGELRHYQSEARGWLEFLDRGGLGGCLAMDMGLGKTPTVLAHLLATRGNGPSLVVAPPAVLGNWAAEAQRFTPELRVRVHHGTARASADEIVGMTGDADVIVTTYATAVRDVEALAAVDWQRVVVDEAQTIKNPASDTAQQLRRLRARCRLALTGTPIENGLGDLWAILDFTNPGLVGPRPAFVAQLSKSDGGQKAAGEAALRALNGLLVFRRSKMEPEIAAELPDKIDEMDHCGMTPEQIGLYQAVLDRLVPTSAEQLDGEPDARKGQVLAAITALKQICDHPAAYLTDDTGPLEGRSGKLTRLEELVEAIFAAGERVLVFTHFARWGERLADHLSSRTGMPIACYHGGLTRTVRDRLIREFQEGSGAGALVLSIKAGGSGLNLTTANHVVLYDRWWNPAVEDQARDRAWRIGQDKTVISHRLVCPGTVDERVEEVVAGKRIIADLALPASSSLGDLGPEQLRAALGLRPDALVAETAEPPGARADDAGSEETAA